MDTGHLHARQRRIEVIPLDRRAGVRSAEAEAEAEAGIRSARAAQAITAAEKKRARPSENAHRQIAAAVGDRNLLPAHRELLRGAAPL